MEYKDIMEFVEECFLEAKETDNFYEVLYLYGRASGIVEEVGFDTVSDCNPLDLLRDWTNGRRNDFIEILEKYPQYAKIRAGE